MIRQILLLHLGPDELELEFARCPICFSAKTRKAEIAIIYKLSIALIWLVTKQVYNSSP
jgi:hypothetical protein